MGWTVTIQELAKTLGITDTKLRKILREQFPRAIKRARWQWDSEDPQLQQIENLVKGGAAKTAPSSNNPKKTNRAPKAPKKDYVYSPEPEPRLPRLCLWCNGVYTLKRIKVVELAHHLGERQKIAVYECDGCGLQQEVILTLPGWKGE